MKQLAIISGKGGTGKTSLIASFVSLAGTSVISDCDVDAADLHILLNPGITKDEDFYALEIAKIDENLCTRCRLCEQHCRFDAIADFHVDPMKCEGCGVCQFICPENAVFTYFKTVGKVFTSETKYGEFIHGRLNPGSTNSGKMVTRIREMAQEKAKENNIDLILIDGSPGIGCPVIASITGVDMVLIISEPTLSGIHDLKRVIALTEHFKVKSSIIINKFDINEVNCRFIEDLCDQHGIPLLGKIPFDTVFTESMIAGVPLVEYAQNDISDIVTTIWHKVCEKKALQKQANAAAHTFVQGEAT